MNSMSSGSRFTCPRKATITIKEINDNRYYWQWREGHKVTSKYKGPVNLNK